AGVAADAPAAYAVGPGATRPALRICEDVAVSNVKIQGAMTAIITPFNEQGVDYDRLARNVEDQIAGGIDGLVPMGTTGESPTVSHEEHRKVVEFVVKQVAGRVTVLAGAGSNSTAEALELSRHARSVGA